MFCTWPFAVPVQVQRGVPFSGSPFRQQVPLKLNTSWTRPDLETAACLEWFTWHFLHLSMTGHHCFRPGFRETRHNKPETGARCDTACLPTYLHHWNGVLFLEGDDDGIVPDAGSRDIRGLSAQVPTGEAFTSAPCGRPGPASDVKAA